jgi:hypothetical protein
MSLYCGAAGLTFNSRIFNGMLIRHKPAGLHVRYNARSITVKEITPPYFINIFPLAYKLLSKHVHYFQSYIWCNMVSALMWWTLSIV